MARHDPYKTNTGIHIQWFTVRSTTVYAILACLAAVGLYLLLPAPPPPSPTRPRDVEAARFLSWSGTVEVRRANRYEWTPAHENMALERGDTIRTGNRAEARVRLLDDSIYTIQPNSILVIEDAYRNHDAAAKQTLVCVTSGAVNVQTSDRGLQVQRRVCTPILGAELNDDAQVLVGHDEASNTSRVESPRGVVRVTRNGEDLAVPQGGGIVLQSEGETETFALPNVPVLVSPAHLESVGTGEAVEFRWRDVRGASRYRIVLDRSARFVDPIFVATVSRTSYSQESLGAGTYHWQVSAVDAQDRRSAPAVGTFKIMNTSVASSPPTLELATPSVSSSGLVTGAGRTDAGAIVTVDYGMGAERVDVRADGSFRYLFQVREAGSHPIVVRARNVDGGAIERTVYAALGDRER